MKIAVVMLDSVPDIELIEFLPEFLDGLFNMVSDPNKEIRQQADTALVDFLRDIHSQPDADLCRMVAICIKIDEFCIQSDDF